MTSILEQEVFDHFPCPVIVADEDGKINFMNTSALSLIGHRGQISSLFSGEDEAAWSALMAGKGEGRMELQLGMPQRMTFCVRHVGGEILMVGERPMETADLGDFLCELVGRFHALDGLLQSKEEKLEVSNGLLTHDAANVVTAIYGYLQMLNGESLDEKATRYVSSSLKQTESLIRLIDNARALRAIEVHPLTDPEPIDLMVVIKGCLESIKDMYREEEHRLVNNIPEGEYWVLAEPMVREIFLNLLDNAMRYGDHQPVILEMSARDGMWHFQVIDEGKGIPDERKEYLFMRFDRLNKERKVKGSGLGLSMVRALTERYKGRVWVEDRVPGVYSKGSIFNVLLPQAPLPAISKS